MLEAEVYACHLFNPGSVSVFLLTVSHIDLLFTLVQLSKGWAVILNCSLTMAFATDP